MSTIIKAFDTQLTDIKDGPGALFVITDHPDCSAIVLELSLNKTQLVVKESHKLESPYGLPLTDNCQACTVSRSRDCVAVALYQGIIHILGFSRKGDSVTVASKIECRSVPFLCYSLREVVVFPIAILY